MKIAMLYQDRKFLSRILLPCCAFLLLGAEASAQAADVSGRLITNAALAVNPTTHKLYAVDEDHDAVIVTDESTQQTNRVAVGKGPIAIAVLRALNRVYVVNTDSNSISVIDGKQDVVIATIRGGSHPYTIAANQKTNQVYVAYTYDRILTVIDGKTNAVRSLETGSADGIVIDEKTNTLFLMTYEDPNIRIVNAATGSIQKVSVGAHIWGMAFDAATARLYLAHTATGEVVGLDEKTLQLTRIPVGQIPCALALDPVTRKLYAVNYGDRTLSVIDMDQNKVTSVLVVGDHPQAIVADVRRNRIYVANVHGNSVTVIDGSENKVIGTYEAAGHPYALAIDEHTSQIYAAIYEKAAFVQAHATTDAR